MELYLQFGYGMMEHCRFLVSAWQGGTVVLSPRDLTDEQLGRLSQTIRDLPGGNVLLDPESHFLVQITSAFARTILAGSYSTGTFWQGPALTELLTRLTDLNQSIGSAAFILPGVLADTINDDWFEIHRSIFEEATALNTAFPLYMTIALSADATRNQDQVAALLEQSESWQPAGYYIVCEHPGGTTWSMIRTG